VCSDMVLALILSRPFFSSALSMALMIDQPRILFGVSRQTKKNVSGSIVLSEKTGADKISFPRSNQQKMPDFVTPASWRMAPDKSLYTAS